MERYDSYKDSGVKWLGEIPSHWEMLALKHILKHKKEVVGKRSSQYDLLSLTLKGVIIRDMDNPEGKFPASFDTYQIVEPNDFIFCNFDNEETPRAVGLSQYKGMITGAYDVLYRNNPLLSDKYLIYYFLYIDDSKRFKPLYKGLRKTVPFDSFMSYKIPVPSRGEQDAVVEYLDAATSKIDEAIAQQQKMIDLLNERKQIIINNAVTKGLDPNVKMKPSGIDWIGDIPEHWEIRRMRYLCKITTGNKDTINRVDDGLYPFYVRSPKVERINSYSYDGEAVLMAGDGVGAGKVFHYVNGKFDYHQRVYCFYEIEMIKAKLLYYYMQNLFKYVIEQLSAKSTVDSVRLNMIQDFVVCIPSIKEQIEIVNFIDKEFANIEKAIQISLNQISLLQERKQIIINDVVTGKVKVI